MNATLIIVGMHSPTKIPVLICYVLAINVITSMILTKNTTYVVLSAVLFFIFMGATVALEGNLLAAAIIIVIYVGAISILFIFVLMLTPPTPHKIEKK